MMNSNSGGRPNPQEAGMARPEPREPRVEPRTPAARPAEARAHEPRSPEPRVAEPRSAEARAPASETVPRASVLGPTLKFRGELSAQEDLIVQGSVEGSITHTQSLTIGTDGTVSVTVPGSQTATQVGQIQLANFVNAQGLQPLGGNLYANTASSGTAIVGAPQTNGLGSVNQGYLESSNVDVVQAMVGLISAERAYQLGTQVASAVDNQLNYLAQAANG